jgi:energy-coupling factor transporter transmembrane protein EcfT
MSKNKKKQRTSFMKQKNPWLAIFLTLIFGPFGLLYVSWLSAVVLVVVYYLFKAILPWETLVNAVFWYTIPTLLAFILGQPDSIKSANEKLPSPEPEPEPLPEPTETKTINGRTYAKINGQWFEQ